MFLNGLRQPQAVEPPGKHPSQGMASISGSAFMSGKRVDGDANESMGVTDFRKEALVG